MKDDATRILITGASSGIGAELSRQLCAGGANVVLSARRRDLLESVAEECHKQGGSATVVEADVGKAEGCERLVRDASDILGGIDVVILNAGASHRGFVESLESPEIAEALINVNYLGAVRCAWHALPHLRKSRGRIAVISSLQGKAGFPGNAAYSGSKHALHGFFDSLRSELVNSGISVTIVCPGPVDTDISARPKGAPGVMSVEECASLTITAIEKRKREEIMTVGGKIANYLKPYCPGVIDSYIRKRLDDFYKE